MGFFDLLFGGDSESTSTNQTASQQAGSSVTSLPDWQMAYLRPQLERIAGMASPSYYSGQLTAGRSPTALEAERLALERARAGAPELAAAQGYARDVLSGAYLGANPYLDAAYQNAARRVSQSFGETTLPAIASMFSAAGRYGPGAMGKQVEKAQQTLGDTLGRLATDIYGQDYARERGAMDAAAARAPGLAAASYTDADALARYGAASDAYGQAAIDRDVQRWQFDQQAPWQAEQARLAMLAGDYGRQVDTTGMSSSYGYGTQTQPTGGMLAGLFGTGLQGGLGAAGGTIGQSIGGYYGNQWFPRK